MDYHVLVALLELEESGRSGVLATIVRTTGSTPLPVGSRMLIDSAGSITGTIGGGSVELQVIEQAKSLLSSSQPILRTFTLTPEGNLPDPMFCGGELEILLEPIINQTVYIFGAGHVGRALAQLCRLIGLKVCVVDDREGFLEPKVFPDADSRVHSDFTGCQKIIPHPANSYVVVVTSGHKHDTTVVEQLISLPLKYIGMIGSRTKVAGVKQRLQEANIPQEAIDTLHAPIGLEINAITAEEIAVSIVSQIIQIKNQKR